MELALAAGPTVPAELAKHIMAAVSVLPIAAAPTESALAAGPTVQAEPAEHIVPAVLAQPITAARTESALTAVPTESALAAAPTEDKDSKGEVSHEEIKTLDEEIRYVAVLCDFEGAHLSRDLKLQYSDKCMLSKAVTRFVVASVHKLKV